MERNQAYYQGASSTELIIFISLLLIALIILARTKLGKSNKQKLGSACHKYNAEIFNQGKAIIPENSHTQTFTDIHPSEDNSISKKEFIDEQIQHIHEAQKERDILEQIYKDRAK